MATGKRRSTSQLVRDRRRIADLYLQGWLQVDIADELHIDQSTVSRDLKAIQAAWVRSTLIDFDAAKAREVAKVDRLEREYWQAWQESKKEKVSTSTETAQLKDGKRNKAQIRREERNGDPRYLLGVQWCIDKRCKILGLDAPKAVDVRITEGEVNDAIEHELARLARAQETATTPPAGADTDAAD